MTSSTDLMGLLVSQGWLDTESAQSARREVADLGAPPIQVLRRRGLVADGLILEALRRHLGLAEIDPDDERLVDLDTLRRIPRELAEAHLVLPLGVWREGETPLLRLAMADPLHEPSLREVEAVSGLGVEPLLAEAGRLERSIAASYDRITTRLIPRPQWDDRPERGVGTHRPRWPAAGANEPETAPSHRLEDEATPLQQVEALRLLLERKGLITHEEFVEALKALLRGGAGR